MSGSDDPSVPVGCVLPYAGKLGASDLIALGWAICGGTQFGIGQYPELFRTIGTSNGGDGLATFNIPDYRGFFLRGVDASGEIDPEASTRAAPRSGAASGARAGSIQAGATAMPQLSPPTAQVPHIPQGVHFANPSPAPVAGTEFVTVPATEAGIATTGGGDAETRPINAYVNFIIKLTPSAALLAGTTVPYAGNKPRNDRLQWYLPCDGTSFAQADLPQLSAAIGTAHGGDGTRFNVPDYRGFFLRGVDGTAQRDPDRDRREAMAPGGSAGNAVGSVQKYATARPVAPFTSTVTLCPYYFNAWPTNPPGNLSPFFNFTAADVPVFAGPGDKESRPVNINVDYYVLKQAQAGVDQFPIGAMIGVPGDTPPDPTVWLPCDGRALSKDDPAYQSLLASIWYDNGGDFPATFNLPNYQGRFLRGTDRGQGRDPDTDYRVPLVSGGQSRDNVGSYQYFATGQPRAPITASIPHLPTKSGNTIKAGELVMNVANWVDSPSYIEFRGGDRETRPINVSIQFYIKYR